MFLEVRESNVAARTLYEFVFDLFTVAGMPTMDYDSVALMHSSSHGANLYTGSYALSATNLIVLLTTMRKQADQTNSKRLGITGRNGYLRWRRASLPTG